MKSSGCTLVQHVSYSFNEGKIGLWDMQRQCEETQVEGSQLQIKQNGLELLLPSQSSEGTGSDFTLISEF